MGTVLFHAVVTIETQLLSGPGVYVSRDVPAVIRNAAACYVLVMAAAGAWSWR